MGIYPKKLRNIESLEREKKLLLRTREELDKEEISLPFGILGKNKNQEDNGGGRLIDILSLSNPLVKGVLKHIQNRRATKKKRSQPAKDESAGDDNQRNLLLTIAKEFIGGYLKWKAVELTYKGIRRVVKIRRQKKNTGTKA